MARPRSSASGPLRLRRTTSSSSAPEGHASRPWLRDFFARTNSSAALRRIDKSASRRAARLDLFDGVAGTAFSARSPRSSLCPSWRIPFFSIASVDAPSSLSEPRSPAIPWANRARLVLLFGRRSWLRSKKLAGAPACSHQYAQAAFGAARCCRFPRAPSPLCPRVACREEVVPIRPPLACAAGLGDVRGPSAVSASCRWLSAPLGHFCSPSGSPLSTYNDQRHSSRFSSYTLPCRGSGLLPRTTLLRDLLHVTHPRSCARSKRFLSTKVGRRRFVGKSGSPSRIGL